MVNPWISCYVALVFFTLHTDEVVILHKLEERIREAVSELANTTPAAQITLSRVAELADVSAPTVRKYVKGKHGLGSFMARHNIVCSNSTLDTRAMILDGARRVFAECGYDGATMDCIATAAGVTKGAVYHHFENKKELFWNLSEQRMANQANMANSAALTEGASAEQNLQALFTSVLESLAAEPGWTRLHYELLSRTRDPDTAELFQRQESFLTHMISADIEAGQKRGEFRSDIAPQAMAIVITAIIGRLSQYAMLGIEEPDVMALLPDIAKIVVSGSGNAD